MPINRPDVYSGIRCQVFQKSSIKGPWYKSIGQLRNVGAAPVQPVTTFTIDTSKDGVSGTSGYFLPLLTAGTYNFDVDWGDGTTDTILSYGQPEATHTYAAPGVYEIKMTANEENGINRITFRNGDQNKLIEISDWGEAIVNLADDVLRECAFLTSVPSAIVLGGRNVSGYAFAATRLWEFGDLSGWGTAANPLLLTNSSFAFAETGRNLASASQVNLNFHATLTGDCRSMFYLAKWNGDLTNWNTSGMTNANAMFLQASEFNGDITGWDMSNVSNMGLMFNSATSFNQDIGGWDVSSNTTFYQTFNSARAFNQDISGWNVSNVTSFEGMFANALAFNQPLDSWDVSSGTQFRFMFQNAIAFNQDLNSWNVTGATQLFRMFSNASAFNGNITSWNVSNITNFSETFINSSFNQPIGGWNTSAATLFTAMFQGTPFNQDISGWDVSGATNFGSMFNGSGFNQPLNSWDTSSMTSMISMFRNNTGGFNQDLDNWNISGVTSLANVFEGCGDFNGNISTWDTTNVTSMFYFLRSASSFSGDISGWNTPNLVIMNRAFEGAVSFNPDLSSWNISSLTDANSAFNNCGLTYPNYDALLNGWWGQAPNINSGVQLSTQPCQYTAPISGPSRDQLTGAFTWTIADQGPRYLLDGYVQPFLAFAFVRLRTDNIKPCFRLTRASDSATTDIGFDSNGLIDKTAIQTFCGASEGRVLTWYNQGTGPDLGPAASLADAPLVYDGTQVLIGDNGLLKAQGPYNLPFTIDLQDLYDANRDYTAMYVGAPTQGSVYIAQGSFINYSNQFSNGSGSTIMNSGSILGGDGISAINDRRSLQFLTFDRSSDLISINRNDVTLASTQLGTNVYTGASTSAGLFANGIADTIQFYAHWAGNVEWRSVYEDINRYYSVTEPAPATTPVIESTSNYTNAHNGIGTFDVTMPTGVVAGDMILVVGAIDESAGVQSLFAPDGYTETSWKTDGFTDVGLLICYRMADGTEGANIVMKYDTPGSRNVAVTAYRISGSSLAAPTQLWASAPNYVSNYIDLADTATTANDALVIAVAAYDGSDADPWNVTAGSPPWPNALEGFIEYPTDFFAAISLGYITQEVASGTTTTLRLTGSASDGWQAALIQINNA